MSEQTLTSVAQPVTDALDPVDVFVRAAFTERIRADVARLLADSLAARAANTGTETGALGATRRLRREATEHEREAHRFEERVAMLRQLAHDGRL